MYNIIDNIYISNWDNAKDKNLLIKNEIKCVIRLSEDENKSPYNKNILYYNFEIEDNFLYKNKIIGISQEIYEIIKKNKEKNILIHCNEGRSRSVTVIIYYLMTKYKYTTEEALNHIKKIKNDINPNSSFINKLKEYEKKIIMK